MNQFYGIADTYEQSKSLILSKTCSVDDEIVILDSFLQTTHVLAFILLAFSMIYYFWFFIGGLNLV